MEFREWLDESVVKFSNIGEAMKRTLEFSGPDVEWNGGPEIYKKVTRISPDIVNSSYILAGSFRTPKIMWTPYEFTLVAKAIQTSGRDLEYDSVSGEKSLYIKAWILIGLPILDSQPRSKPPAPPASLSRVLATGNSVTLSRRWGPRGPGRWMTLDDTPWEENQWKKPGFFPEFDGPFLNTPLELAQWVKKVVENTDVEGGDDNDEEPDAPEVPTPDAGKLVGV